MFQLAVVDPIPIQGAKMSSKLSKWLLDIKSKRQERNWREFSSLDLFSLTFKKFFSSSFGGGGNCPYRPLFDHTEASFALEGSSYAKNQLNSFSRFDRTPTCDRRTDMEGHGI